MFPLKENTVFNQRRRWEHGHMELFFNVAPMLILKGLLRRNKDQLALGLELAAPPIGIFDYTRGCRNDARNCFINYV
jgi:hypothetical protein